MPLIDPTYLRCVFYLYRDRASASDGKGAVGTGFIMALVSEVGDHGNNVRHYGISNKHVVCAKGGSVIRLNTRDAPEILEFGPEDWEFHAAGDDVAAVSLKLDPNKHEVSAAPSYMCLSGAYPGIGVGDDAFMLGMFADHEGIERNNPLARFGNLSMLAAPDSLVRIGKRLHECHVVDIHSRSGFSGSPVFVYRSLGMNLTNSLHFGGDRVSINIKPITNALQYGHFFEASGELNTTLRYDPTLRLLGIHFAQFPEIWSLEDSQEDFDEIRASYDGKSVIGVSGMTCVVPSWKILELLDQPKFGSQRDL